MNLFRSLRHRDFRGYMLGGLVSSIGIWMQRVAQDWMVLQLSGNSALAVSLAVTAQFLPTLLVTPLAGVLSDRLDRRRLLLLSNAGMGVTAAVLGAVALTGHLTLGWVYLPLVVFGVFSALEAPTRMAYMSELVPRHEITNAVALGSATFNIARMIGPAVAGVAIALLGSDVPATGWVILATGISFAAVLGSLWRIRLRPDSANLGEGAPRRGQFRDGLRHAAQNRQIAVVLAIIVIVGAFGLNFQLSLTVMATQAFGRGAAGLGLLSSVLAVGSLAGALIGARRATVDHRVVIRSAVAFGLALMAAGTMPSYWVFVAWVPVLGLCSLGVLTAANGTLQLASHPDYRGRVMSLYMTCLLGGAPLMSPALGALAEWAGPRAVMWVGGAVITLGAALIALLGKPGPAPDAGRALT